MTKFGKWQMLQASFENENDKGEKVMDRQKNNMQTVPDCNQNISAVLIGTYCNLM